MSQPKKILAAKDFTGNPFDSIDNILLMIFGRISGSEIAFYAKGIFEEKGALKKMHGSRYGSLLAGRYNMVWGVGHVKEFFLAALRPRRTKYCINFQAVLFRNGEGRWQVKTPWFLRKYLFSQADAIFTPSEFSTRSVQRYFPNKKIIGILNGVDISLFNPDKKNRKMLAEQYDIHAGQPIIAFVGGLQARKRPDVFIEIARRFPDAHFVAVGRKMPEHDFIKAAEGLANFQWIPLMSREDIAVLLASSRVFIFPSLDEPSAAVILEAMASGAVPILSNSGGNPEFLGDGQSGFLVENNDTEVDGFLDILQKLVSDGDLWKNVSMAARREAERHSYDMVAEQYKDAIIKI
jgi:glycosyltransferase involved in cell wall biosynthesis